MLYSKEQYETWIKKFLDCKEYTRADVRNILLNDSVLEADLFNDETQDIVSVLAELIVDKMCRNCQSYQVLQMKRMYVKMFYEWAVGQEDIKVYTSPFWDEEDSDGTTLAPRPLFFRLIEKDETVVINDEVIQSILKKITINRAVYEFIIKMFYYGYVKDYVELSSIRSEDVHLAEKYMIVSGNRRVFSEEMAECIRAYLDTKSIVVESGKGTKTVNVKVIEDRLYRLTQKTKGETYNENTFKASLKTRFMQISDMAGFTVRADGLYHFGFVNYVRKELLNDRLFQELFFEVAHSRAKRGLSGAKGLEQYAKEFGMKKQTKFIRRDCQFYAIKLISLK